MKGLERKSEHYSYEPTKADIAQAIIDRLVDNYEGKGEDIQAFYRLTEMLAQGIAKSRDFEDFEELAYDMGIIEEDYFTE
jgi:hypothetical protein